MIIPLPAPNGPLFYTWITCCKITFFLMSDIIFDNLHTMMILFVYPTVSKRYPLRIPSFKIDFIVIALYINIEIIIILPQTSKNDPILDSIPSGNLT